MFAHVRRAALLLLATVAGMIPGERIRAQEEAARKTAPEGTEPAFVKGSATLVVLPDTEVYANKSPHIFEAMFKWIAANIEKRNIVSVLHVGDITNRNTDREWQVVRKSYDLIEGRVPYVLAAGNHDYDGTEGRLTLMNKYFHASEQKKWPGFGDVFEKDKLENHYQFVKIQGRRWIILSLEMGPRKVVIEWANRVLKEHKDKPAILLTHGYLCYENERYNHLKGSQRASPYNFYGDGADGEMLWNALVRRHPNVMIVQCGHLSSAYVGYRADEADYGNIVHQTMVDYEKMKGGYGFLRLLEFLPDGKTVQVRTYSPVTGKTNPRDPKLEEFTFRLQGAPRKEPRPVLGDASPLSRPPIHRYSFDTLGEKDAVPDSVGTAHGRLERNDSDSRIDGKGRLVLTGAGRVALPPDMLKSEDASFEVWFAATGDTYRWTPAVYFGNGKGDFFWYNLRTRTTHRVDISINGDNQRIQVGVPVENGRIMHVVVTCKRDAATDSSRLFYYRDGEQCGSVQTKTKLTDVKDTKNTLGAFEGIYDEFRVYDYALSREEVRGNFSAGPQKLNLAGKD